MIAAIDPDLFSRPSYGIEIKNHRRQFLLISQLPDPDADRIGPVPDPIKLGSVGKSNPTGTLLKKASRKKNSIRLAPRTGPDSFNLVLRYG